MLNIFLETVFSIILILPFLCLFGMGVYLAFVRNIIYKYRLHNCQKLYPEYFEVLNARNNLYNNELLLASSKQTQAELNIDSINEELPYTPLEDISAKQMQIEVLKKERTQAKADIKKYRATMNICSII